MEAIFTLTEEDKEYLKEHFYEDNAHIKQIEDCVPHTKFTLCYQNFDSCTCKKMQSLELDDVIERLGRMKFLNAMDRCAFHYSSVAMVKETAKGEYIIHFDATEFFK